MRIVSTEEPSAEEAQTEVPGAHDDSQTMALLMRETIRDHRKQMRANEKAIRADGDAEGVHDMRVASRGLRAELDVFVEVGALGRRDGRRVGRQLRRLARALGRVRDLDVMMQSATDYTTANAGTSEALTEWMERLSQQHQKARKCLLRALDGKQYTSLMSDLRQLGKRSRADAQGDPLLVRQCAGSTIWRRYEAVLVCGGRGLEGMTPESLHELRIACKRLRYVVDLFAEALGAESEAVQEVLVRTQKSLGAAHDVSTRLAALRRFRRKHSAAQGLQEYERAETTRLESLVADAVLIRAELEGERFRRAVAGAIAAL